MSASLALSVIFVVVSFGGTALGQQYDGQYPSFPMLPWLTVPQRYTSGSNLGPLVMPNPPIFAQSASADQDLAFSNYRWQMFYNHDTTTVAAAATTTAATNTTGAAGGVTGAGKTGGSGTGSGGTGTDAAAPGGSSGAAGTLANGGVNANSGGLGQNGGSGTGNLGAQGSVAGLLGGGSGNGRVDGSADSDADETTAATETTTNSTVATTPALNFSAVASSNIRGGQPCKSPQVPASGSQTGICVAETSAALTCTRGVLVVATQCRFFQKCCVVVTNDPSR
ncbi:hypothetical protein RvY_14468 [Ramazzottius varieornatus]|uniref:Uncharacterized protein n=1 Tax=Ramazzottius varieornatus TaxID=947166 RepID=A0A1D1VRG1_RAMVA|nr:hypothetical protein RvY_14468 [Ramazzottius varieornatus]